MKKLIAIILLLGVLCGAYPLLGVAAETDTEPPQTEAPLSQPRLMVTSYQTDDTIRPNKNSNLSIVFTNTHKSETVKNIRLTFSGEGAVLAAKTASVHVESIAPGKTYTWKLPVTAAAGAESGKVAASVTAEYEAGSGEVYSVTDALTLTVSNPPKETAAPTQPRLMVTEYAVENDWIAPGEQRKLTVTIKNTSSSANVRNLKLTLSDESGELLFDGLGTAYPNKLSAGKTYSWEITLSAVPTAQSGTHNLSVLMEYEDAEGNAYTASDTLRVIVRQSVALTWDGAALPARIVQGETESVAVNLMNTGKSPLYNCAIRFDVDGLTSGGSVFVGEIPSGESKSGSANLRAAAEKEGKVSGTLTITYEDAYGEVHEEVIDVSTEIAKKVEQAAAQAEKEEENKNTLWWLFLLAGLLVGGGAGFGIPFAIHARKQRKEDEERL